MTQGSVALLMLGKKWISRSVTIFYVKSYGTELLCLFVETSVISLVVLLASDSLPQEIIRVRCDDIALQHGVFNLA